jgi:hypothetical protein
LEGVEPTLLVNTTEYVPISSAELTLNVYEPPLATSRGNVTPLRRHWNVPSKSAGTPLRVRVTLWPLLTGDAGEETILTVGGDDGLVIVKNTVPPTIRALASSTPFNATGTVVLLPETIAESGASTLRLPESRRNQAGTDVESTKLHTGLNEPALTTLELKGIVAGLPATAVLFCAKDVRISIARSTFTNTVTCVVPLAFVAPIFNCFVSAVAPGVIAPNDPEISPLLLSKLKPAPSALNCAVSTE